MFVTGLANFVAATIADAFGYAATFGLGIVIALAGCLVLVAILDARRGAARFGLAAGLTAVVSMTGAT